MTDYQLINAEQLKRFRMDHPHLDDVDMMAQLNIELAQLLHRIEAQRRMATNKEENPLQSFTSLRPNQEQIRTALLRLLEMPCPEDSSRKLIYKKSHWLAVMKVMQFLGEVSYNYGARQEFVDYLNNLLPGNKLGITAANLKGIESESPFNRKLPDWHERLNTPRAKYYWRISITFLECLAK